MMRAAFAFLLLAVLGSVYAGQAWRIAVPGGVEAAPAIYEDKVAVGSRTGSYILAYKDTGVIIKRMDLGMPISRLQLLDSGIIASGKNGAVILDREGKELWNVTRSNVYGAYAADALYVSSDSGIEKIGFDGKTIWVRPMGNLTMTAPFSDFGKVIVGAGETMYQISASDGSVEKSVSVGPVWPSMPAFDGTYTYYGGTDGKLYALDITAGKIAWEIQAGSWSLASPLYSNGAVYFGCEDGSVFAVSGRSGALIWKAKTDSAVRGGISPALLSGRSVILFGGNGRAINAADTKTGELLLSFPSNGWTRSTVAEGNTVYFGSYDNDFYAYNSDRSCIITAPQAGTIVGYIPFNASGKVFSIYPNPQAQVRVDGGAWTDTSKTGGIWSTAVNPNGLEFGNMTLECRIMDNAGAETQSFSSVFLWRSQNSQKDTMSISSSNGIMVSGGVAQISAKNARTNEPLDSFTVEYDNKADTGSNGSFSAKLDGVGTHTFTVRKDGYDDATVSVNVVMDYTFIISIIAGVVIIGAALFYALVYRRK
jgi:outer membrane protein assembly factor BamB